MANSLKFCKTLNFNISGDWTDLAKNDCLLPSNYFDLILTSETIYNENNYRSLLNLFTKCLTRPYGLVLLSAKTCYFGCGGAKTQIPTNTDTFV